MALQAKKLASGAKKIFMSLTTENKISNGGGLSSLIIPRQVNGKGIAVIAGASTLLSLGDTGIKTRNKTKMGRVSYGDGPARMTSSFTTGAVDAMKRASGNNPQVFSEMAQDVVTGRGIGGKLETYGATPELISSLYNMGGR